MAISTTLQQRVLVVPALPPIDKYIAAKRVMLDWEGIAKFRVVFCDVNVPGPKQYGEWDGDNPGSAILIDVGDEKYHGRCQSAAEMQKMKSHTQHGATWNKLQEMANRNNATGYLKQPQYSVAKMIREIPHLFADRKQGEKETWAYGMDVVDSYFWRLDRREWETLFADSQYANLRKMWEAFGITDQELADFTLPLYFRRMFRSGRPEQEIMRRMSWWLDHTKAVIQKHERARRMQFTPKRLEIQGTQATAGLIKVNDYFESGAFNYQWLGSGKLAVAVIRNRFGGAVIMSSAKHKTNLQPLYEELARREPTRWYFEGRFASGHMIMNQSWQFIGITPTSMTDQQLMHEVITRTEYGNRKTTEKKSDLPKVGAQTSAKTKDQERQPAIDPTATRLGMTYPYDKRG